MFRKKRDPLSYVERVQALQVEPGDVLVVTIPRSVQDPEIFQQAKRLFTEALSGLRTTVLVVHAGTEVSLVRSAPADLSADIRTAQKTVQSG